MKKIIKIILALIVVILFAAGIYLNSLLDIITGYTAKNLASGVFISERSQEDMEATDLNFSFIALAKSKIDIDNKTVTSRFLWGKSVAVYREGFGVTLLRDIKTDDLRSVSFPDIPLPGFDPDTLMWPMGNIIPEAATGIDLEKIDQIANNLVNEDSYGGSAYAFMVLHKGVPVTESYKKRFDRDTKFLSWSMAKSVTNALVGVLAEQGRVDINDPVEIDEWAGDKRSEISLNNLLQEQSGLHWNEDYGNRSDVTVMLHEAFDFAKFAYEQELDYEPGTNWYYSSGTANIISYIIRQNFTTDNDYYTFPHKQLLHRIGIADAILEVDPSGTMVGSSYIYMTARDYSRFALLYQQNGIFCGDTILPQGWVDYTVSEASSSGGEYGSLFWLNYAGEVPSAPANMYICIGHDGQRIFILPDEELIVVVLGYSPNNSMDFNRLMGDILGTTLP